MRFLATLVLALLTALPLSAQQLSLQELSRYLNQLTSAQGSFTQINADGTISTGTISLRRPGKIRFEYNPPDQALVMASHGSVVIFDKKLGGDPEVYPLKRTPLNLILARNVDLSRADMVVAHGYDGTATTVTAQDPEHPEYGTIQLVFTDNPVELRQWVVTDDTGNQTTVILGALERKDLPDRLFDIEEEDATLNPRRSD